MLQLGHESLLPHMLEPSKGALKPPTHRPITSEPAKTYTGDCHLQPWARTTELGSEEDSAKQKVRKVIPSSCPPSQQLPGMSKLPPDGSEPTSCRQLGLHGVGPSLQACPRVAMWPAVFGPQGSRRGAPSYLIVQKQQSIWQRECEFHAGTQLSARSQSQGKPVSALRGKREGPT